MIRAACLAFLPVLAACQPVGGSGPTGSEIAGPPRVAVVEARANRVILRISDGSRCVGSRPEGERSGWSGITDEACGYALPYTVAFRQGGSPQRFTIEDPRGTLTQDGVPGPRAEVFVTDTDGQRRLFVVPLGRGTRIELAGS
jgi:hypothetical protein